MKALRPTHARIADVASRTGLSIEAVGPVVRTAGLEIVEYAIGELEADSIEIGITTLHERVIKTMVRRSLKTMSEAAS